MEMRSRNVSGTSNEAEDRRELFIFVDRWPLMQPCTRGQPSPIAELLRVASVSGSYFMLHVILQC